MKRTIFSLFAILVAISVVSLTAQAQQRRTAEEYIKLLESESRISGLQIEKVIGTLRVSPGQKVADIGSGSGLFTRPIAKAVGVNGTVFAVDVDPELLKHVEKSASRLRMSNIKTVLAPYDDPKIPEKVDLIVIIDTVHHIQNQGAYLKKLRQYMNPGARVAIIDFSNDWPAGHENMRYTVEDLQGWMSAAGFKQVEKHDFLENNFFLVFQ
ncbi:MAG: methyltransferase domain-containing protein [Acidobacteriota bacterium]|nr:MAG: methyltransferase domain-containing protein [Acidobacteriota bacterium]